MISSQRIYLSFYQAECGVSLCNDVVVAFFLSHASGSRLAASSLASLPVVVSTYSRQESPDFSPGEECHSTGFPLLTLVNE